MKSRNDYQFDYLREHGLFNSMKYSYYKHIHGMTYVDKGIIKPMYPNFTGYVNCIFHYIRFGIENKGETEDMLKFFKIKQRKR